MKLAPGTPLAAESTAILTGHEGELADTLAALAGGSGGARPKVHVGFDAEGRISISEGETAAGHEAWLVKFAATNDPPDIGPIEAAYAAMALTAGLDMAPYRLLPSKTGPGYFATRRFDRPRPGQRLHMASLSGAVEAPWRTPASYDLFLRATVAITRHAEDLQAAFRRMVFNVLASNRDDHTRQHSYLMDAQGRWRLAPAYDLTYSVGPGGEHYLDVEGEGKNPTREQAQPRTSPWPARSADRYHHRRSLCRHSGLGALRRGGRRHQGLARRDRRRAEGCGRTLLAVNHKRTGRSGRSPGTTANCAECRVSDVWPKASIGNSQRFAGHL